MSTQRRDPSVIRIEHQFGKLADDLLRRGERIPCTLEERQRGLLEVQRRIDLMLRIVTEERLKH